MVFEYLSMDLLGVDVHDKKHREETILPREVYKEQWLMTGLITTQNSGIILNPILNPRNKKVTMCTVYMVRGMRVRKRRIYRITQWSWIKVKLPGITDPKELDTKIAEVFSRSLDSKMLRS